MSCKREPEKCCKRYEYRDCRRRHGEEAVERIFGEPEYWGGYVFYEVEVSGPFFWTDYYYDEDDCYDDWHRCKKHHKHHRPDGCRPDGCKPECRC